MYTAELYSFSDLESKYDFTVTKMAELARKYSAYPDIRAAAVKIIHGVAGRDYVGELAALHTFVRDKIKFVKDTYNKELLQTPSVTLQIGAGDCDDKTTLMAALALAVGHRAAFSTVKIGGEPHYSHVYPEVFINGNWIPAETVRPLPLGKTVAHTERKRYVLC